MAAGVHSLLKGRRMTTLSTTEAHEKFSELLRRVAAEKERIILTRAGEELVAVIPIEDLALVEAREDRADLEDAREALREAREKGTTPLADLEAYSSTKENREQAVKKLLEISRRATSGSGGRRWTREELHER